MYLTGRANSATVLCSEANVPIADSDSLIDELFSYANGLASASGAEQNYYTAFASVRFSGASQHLMASSYGGPRAYVEAPVVQGLDYQANEQSADQIQLIDGCNFSFTSGPRRMFTPFSWAIELPCRAPSACMRP